MLDLKNQISWLNGSNIDFKFEKKGKNAQISNSGHTVKNSIFGFSIVLGDLELTSGKHYWTYRIDKMTASIVFGVAAGDVNLNNWPNGQDFWGYVVSDGTKIGKEKDDLSVDKVSVQAETVEGKLAGKKDASNVANTKNDSAYSSK